MTTQLLARATLSAVCVAGAAACAVAYVSVVQFAGALDTSLHTGDAARALRELRASDSPLNPTAHREGAIGLALLLRGRPAAAERVVARAARREPRNADTWGLLARIQVTRHRLAAARVSWARARRLYPRLRRALPAALAVPRKR